MPSSPAFCRRHRLAAAFGGAAGLAHAKAEPPLTVVAFPLVDVIAQDLLKGWSARHPEVRTQVVSRRCDLVFHADRRSEQRHCHRHLEPGRADPGSEWESGR